MRKKLIKFLAFLLCFSMMAVINVSAQTITTNQNGTEGGYYYEFWTDTPGAASMYLNGGGSYSVDWTYCGDFICGKGWNPGSGHTIAFSGSYTCTGGGAFGIHGWTINPRIEYYIVEKTGDQGGPVDLTNGAQMGTVNSDGSIYTIYKRHVNLNDFVGFAFDQYINIRQSQRTSGIITIQNHFDAWQNLGMNLGTIKNQILSTEGVHGSGSSSCTVSEVSSPTPANTPTPTSRQTTTPSTITTPTQRPNTPTPTRRPGTTPRGNNVVTYTIQSDWGTGATINVTIKNNTGAAVNGWTLAFTFPGNQTITNLWNGTYTQSGATVSVKNAASNAYIPANGGSVNFGFNLKYSGTNAKPLSFTLNGTACTIQ
ncbi:MAG TPA: glycoside hydrolase family 11 protein [Bacillota bacterium]|nr:glycoside hydrolase family 11 protein [Bacillota bacterium]